MDEITKAYWAMYGIDTDEEIQSYYDRKIFDPVNAGLRQIEESFIFDAAEYFKTDTDATWNDGDMVVVHVNHRLQSAQYAVCKGGVVEGHEVFKEDDYDGVMRLVKAKGILI